jgi:hypothetical protein
MNSMCKAAGVVLMAAFLTGCRHETQVTPPPAAEAPIVPVSVLAKNIPPPQLPPLESQKVNPPGTKTSPPPPKPKTHKIVHHKPKPTDQTPSGQGAGGQTTAQTQTKDQTAVDVAGNGASPDVTPIGQLAAAGETGNAPRRVQILKDIDTTERDLNDIKRSLTKDEETTAGQIRTFLAKARDALTQEDLDAASSLVTRAKVLLTELTKS